MFLSFFYAIKARHPSVQWSDLRLWKMDLKGAFTLLDFAPEGVPFLGTEVPGGLVVFYLVGLYGWKAMPMAFQVVNRAVVWELCRPGVLKGRMNMYTDDMFGITLKEDLQHDMDVAASFCRRLLSDTAIKEEKTESGTRLTIIGWDFDLDQVLVTIARRNALKAWHGYSRADLSLRMRVPVVQAWASWAQRYGDICLWMRPFRREMYNLVRGQLKCRTVAITPVGHRVVRLYQALLTLTLTQEGRFTRSFESFRLRAPTLRITFDGSLGGTGLMFQHLAYRPSTQDLPPLQLQTLLGLAALSLHSLGLGGDPAYQNVCEYISILLGLIIAVLMRWDTSAVEIVGDSVTALMWTRRGRFRSDNVINAATVCAALGATHPINLVSHRHLLAENNMVTDTLSRRRKGESWSALLARMQKRAPEEYGNMGALPGHMPREFKLRRLEQILSLCDPRRVFVGEKEFAMYWRGVRSLVENMSVQTDL